MKKLIITLTLVSSLFATTSAFAANDNSSNQSNYIQMLNQCKAVLKQTVGQDWKEHIEIMKDGNCPSCGMNAEDCLLNIE